MTTSARPVTVIDPARTNTLTVEKRDGRQLPFDTRRISGAIRRAYREVHGEVTAQHAARVEELAGAVVAEVRSRFSAAVKIYEIQSAVEHTLLGANEYDVARAYIDCLIASTAWLRSVRNSDSSFSGITMAPASSMSA